jgi:hypothetical protein
MRHPCFIGASIADVTSAHTNPAKRIGEITAGSFTIPKIPLFLRQKGPGTLGCRRIILSRSNTLYDIIKPFSLCDSTCSEIRQAAGLRFPRPFLLGPTDYGAQIGPKSASNPTVSQRSYLAENLGSSRFAFTSQSGSAGQIDHRNQQENARSV